MANTQKKPTNEESDGKLNLTSTLFVIGLMLWWISSFAPLMPVETKQHKLAEMQQNAEIVLKDYGNFNSARPFHPRNGTGFSVDLIKKDHNDYLNIIQAYKNNGWTFMNSFKEPDETWLCKKDLFLDIYYFKDGGIAIYYSYNHHKQNLC